MDGRPAWRGIVTHTSLIDREHTMKTLCAALAVVLGCVLGGVIGCQDENKPANKSSASSSSASVAMPTKSLYERLGGEPALKLVVDDFVARAASDPKVNFTRKGTPMEWQATPENVAKLKVRLVQFISMATGGPSKYEGRSMKAAHAGMKITDAEFNALAADLIAALDKYNVPKREKDELIAIVGTTKADIVEVK
jgi:hemoglobin